MSSSSKKEDARQEDIVRQERDTAASQANEYSRQNESALDAFLGQMNRLISDEQPEQRQRLESILRLQPQMEDILRNISQGRTSGYYTPLESQIQGRLSQDLTNPTQSYEDTFTPQFELLRDKMRSQAAQRGIVGSGLELENMGRAGIDLAIAQANARNQSRQQGISNALAGNQQVEGGVINRQAGLQNYLANLQSMQSSERARQSQLGEQAALMPLNVRTQTSANMLNVNDAARQRTFGLESDVLMNQIGQRQAQNAAIGQMVGAGAGAAASFIPGVGPIVGPMIQQGVSGAMGGGGQAGLQIPMQQPSYTQNSGEAMRSSYRYGSQRPSLFAQLQGRNW
jgi:hypothetical protein